MYSAFLPFQGASLKLSLWSTGPFDHSRGGGKGVCSAAFPMLLVLWKEEFCYEGGKGKCAGRTDTTTVCPIHDSHLIVMATFRGSYYILFTDELNKSSKRPNATP